MNGTSESTVYCCPSCESPQPSMHPATQAEGGEVLYICPDPWHEAAKCERCGGYCTNGAECAISQLVRKPRDWREKEPSGVPYELSLIPARIERPDYQ